MTKTTLAIFGVAVLLLVIAAFFDLPQLGGSASLLMLAGLAYAFVVTKRDIERSRFTRH